MGKLGKKYLTLQNIFAAKFKVNKCKEAGANKRGGNQD